jgi:type I restriction enzyme M protein
MTDVTGRLWGFCHTLRHEGIDYGDYIEQITYLLFLKMAQERDVELPEGCSWDVLRKESGTALLDAYVDMLRELGRQPAILGDIFSGAQSRFANPVSLKKLVGLIDETEWTELDVDVKAAAFEGLLEKAASEGKKGAGQYFTPRLLIDAIVRCVKPDPRTAREFRIADPACGTGGFLVSAYEWLVGETAGGGLERATAKRVVNETYFGQDLVARPRRLALMNLYLHGLEPRITIGDSIYDPPSSDRFDVVLTNPPFGTRGANQAPDRDDFTIATSNKQLNFLQHILTVLKPGGRAAVVVPDNVLFADQAGAVFEVLAEDCDIHTIWRLPNGTFTPYSPGTKTNVIFFTKGTTTDSVWIYDGRTNVPHITKKERPLKVGHLAEFERCFGSDPKGRSSRDASASADGRWRRFSIDQIRERGFKIDALRWIRDELDEDFTGLPDPQELVTTALSELELAVAELKAMANLLDSSNGSDAGRQSAVDA